MIVIAAQSGVPKVTQQTAAYLGAIRPLGLTSGYFQFSDGRIVNLFQVVAYFPNNIIQNALFQ
jgi:hypothetical protein